ncbi:MAG: hypothetical protein EBU26_19075, partial [Verrucomicrobia bacterium]|nr:hypothetical protein [Verrucomicrobiota bacterium]
TLSLGDILLGTGTGVEISDEAPITPYDLFGIEEGQLADNVTNFARLLLTLDNDSQPENGIQLNSDLSSNLGTIDNISDFNVDNLTAAHGVSLSVSKEEALQHLHESMRRKNLGLDNYSQYPEPGQDSVALDSIVAIAFAEPLRKRSVDNLSLQISPSGSSSVLSGTVHHQANRLWFVPSAGLSANTDYTITLSSNLRGQSGGVPSISGWTFKSGYHRDNGTADAVRQWLLNSSSVSSGSTGPSLQHKGRYLDNLTNTQLVVLEVGNGGPEFHVADSLEPDNTSLGWRSSAFYPVKVPYKLNRANDGSEEVRVWYRDNASDSAPSHQSVNITLDRTPPYGWITLPKKTNQ